MNNYKQMKSHSNIDSKKKGLFQYHNSIHLEFSPHSNGMKGESWVQDSLGACLTYQKKNTKKKKKKKFVFISILLEWLQYVSNLYN